MKNRVETGFSRRVRLFFFQLALLRSILNRAVHARFMTLTYILSETRPCMGLEIQNLTEHFVVTDSFLN